MATASPVVRTLIRMVSPVGVAQDVAESAAHGLFSAGWTLVAHSSGPTTGRPTTGLFSGMKHFDTTLNKIVVWVGGGGGTAKALAETGFWTDGTGASV